jgi:glycerol-3-phosphate acyltransferase PlsY
LEFAMLVLMQIGSPWAEILIVLAAYFVGGIPFGWLVGRLAKGVDLRTVGSGGTGATNCSRLWQGPASVGMFVVVFVLDFGKGLFGALVSLDLAALIGDVSGSSSSAMTLQVVCGLAAILGHMFTPYLGFRGGKGVATTFGVVTALAPLSALYGLGAWGLLVGITKYMSLGSVAAMLAIPLSYWVDSGSEALRSRLAVTIFLVVTAVVVVWRHRGNIARILQGKERRVGDLDQQL